MVLTPKLRPIVAFLCALAGLPAAPALVDAWNADGHMIVAWIASDAVGRARGTTRP